MTKQFESRAVAVSRSIHGHGERVGATDHLAGDSVLLHLLMFGSSGLTPVMY